MNQAQIDQFKFDQQGLLPAVVQDWLDGTVLWWSSSNYRDWETDRKSVV